MATCPDAAQHPGNNFYVQQVTGTIQQASGFSATIIKGLGYSGPYDWCDAKAYAAAHTESAVVHSPSKVAQGLGDEFSASITGFHGSAFVIRAVKIILGGVLMLSGLIHLAGIDKDAIGVAGKAVIAA